MQKIDDRYHRFFVTPLLPLTSKLEVDEAAYRKLIQMFMKDPRFSKRGGIIANSEAGEVFYLERAQKRRMVEIALEEAGGRVPVFAGTFGLSTKDVVQESKDVKAMGVDGIFAYPPSGSAEVGRVWDPIEYPEVWIDQMKEQDRAIDLPIIPHGTAPFTPAFGGGLPGPAVARMCSEIPNIVGWKMIYNYDGYRRVSQVLRGLKRHVAILPARASNYHEMMAVGDFDGTACGVWNYALQQTMDHIEAWERKDIDAARAIWNGKLGDLNLYIYGGGDVKRLHNRYKIAAWLQGIIESPYMLPPMSKPRSEEIDEIERILHRCGLQTISSKEKALVA
jgi:dihydrodipicolinate synthase/N-acetylneuraminate lyase